MKKSTFLAIYILILFCGTIKPNDQRNLTICLDFTHEDAEKKVSASGLALYDLIKSKSTLILTNEVVWDSFKLFLNKKHLEEVESIIKDFDVYKKDDFLLIVPHNYKNKFTNLGINLEGFVLIKPDCKFEFSYIQSTKNYFYKACYLTIPYALSIKSRQFIKLLQTLIISKKDLEDIFWNICLIGHGFSIFATAGMTEQAFRKILEIFQNHINTHAFFYESCFAGGKIKNFIYEINGKVTKFSYPIFCTGITDMPSFCFSNFNFKTFFELLGSIDINDKKSYLNFIESTFDQYQNNPLNILCVRYPGEDFFSIPIIPKKVFVISDEIKNDTKNLSSYKNIVIDKPIIDEIDLAAAERAPKIISSSCGSFVHYIGKINATSISYPDLFKSFLTPCVCLASSSKIILIKEINCSGFVQDTDDKWVLTKASDSKSIKLNNVIILLKSSTPWRSAIKDHEIFFMTEDDQYQGNCLTLKGICPRNLLEFYDIKTNKINKKLTKRYLNFFNITKSNLEKGIHRISFLEKGFDNHTFRKLFPLIASSSAIINTCGLFSLIF